MGMAGQESTGLVYLTSDSNSETGLVILRTLYPPICMRNVSACLRT